MRRVALSLVAIIVLAGVVLAGLHAAGVRGVLLSTDLLKGRSALAVLRCGYVGGQGAFTLSFARTPESFARCPILVRQQHIDGRPIS